MSQLRLTDFPTAPEPEPPAAEAETKQKLCLRPYQVEAYEAWLGRGCRGVIVAPTGTGKTVITAHAIKKSGLPTLVMVTTERILKTCIMTLERFDIRATVFYGRAKHVSDTNISIYNSVVRHPKVVEGFRMVVLEVHHVAAEVFSRILDLVEGRRVMALTATLRRVDGRHRMALTFLCVIRAGMGMTFTFAKLLKEFAELERRFRK